MPAENEKTPKDPKVALTVVTGTSLYLEHLRNTELNLTIVEDEEFNDFALIKASAPVRPQMSETPFLIALAHGGNPSVEQTIHKAVLCGSRAIYLSTPPVPEPVLFFTHDIDIVSVTSFEEGANYVYFSIKAMLEKKTNCVWQHKGESCRSLSRATTDPDYVTWVSMLMEMPGMSEETAKAVCERYRTPREAVDASKGQSDLIFADIEIPTRGQNTARRLGPALSKKLYRTFTALDPEQHIC
eukprot:GEMP01095935.1.p1 GENE.GEMP01095935.1~~GEMP01095935.1.p1  ORF type:complete len:242 (+),score=40.95 GEMP01095935.1:113-838(+)